MTGISPREHDEREAALFGELEKAESHRDDLTGRMHRAAGDKRIDRFTRRERWEMSNGAALAKLGELAAAFGTDEVIWGNDHPVNILKAWQDVTAEIERLQSDIGEAEAIYRAHRWTRYFPCTNVDGHIHSSLRGCSTVHWNTPMAWYPQLSGKTVDEAVAELGPALCSVCFASAPVEHKAMTLGQVARERTRGDREAAKALREAAKAAKTLTKDQQFRDGRVGHGGLGDWVTTVAGAKKVLREVSEFKHYSGPNNHHSWYEPTLAAAEIATRVLLEREAANPGTGATQDEIDTILAKAEKRQLSYFK